MSAAEKLFADALALPAPERAQLVRRLAATLPSDPAAEALWDAAAHREAWDGWASGGEQGPISDGDGAPELP